MEVSGEESWWIPSRSFATSLCAGAIAGLSVDCMIYPLDTLRARLQAPCGFKQAGGFRSLYQGIHIALLGSAPGSALFFCTFEAMQVPLGMAPVCFLTQVSSSAVAAIVGELAASCVRAPTELFKQRLQTNTKVAAGSLFLGWRATITRDLPFSTIQYPLYSAVKRLFGDSRDKPMEPWKAAICGSITSSIAAAITTPFDLVQTRLMLDNRLVDPTIVSTLRQIYRQEGIGGLFKGVVPRTMWMGLGGFIFLGSYEQAKCILQGDQQDDGKKGVSMVSASRLAASDVSATMPPSLTMLDASSSSNATVTCLSGALAGMAIDGVLHPIDTFKARFMYGGELINLRTAAGFTGLWKGVGMALVPAIPANAAFFTTYETLKSGLERNRMFDINGDGTPHPTACCCMAAAIGEGVAALVRTPTEALKIRLQCHSPSKLDGSIYKAARDMYAHGGIKAFYIGLSATIFLDVPFALLQFPIYETIKTHLALRRMRSATGHVGAIEKTVEKTIDGVIAGGLAGATAGFATTPIDVIRTWHVLAPLSHESLGKSMMETTLNLYEEVGLRGLFRGCIPRTIYTGLGGAVYLGTYSACCSLLAPILGK